MSRPEQSWSYSLGFVFSSIILVYSFAMQNGFISRLLTNNFSMYLAKISPYGFLIHYVIFRYAMAVYYRIPGFEPGEFLIKYGCWLNLTVGFILTIVCCVTRNYYVRPFISDLCIILVSEIIWRSKQCVRYIRNAKMYLQTSLIS